MKAGVRLRLFSVAIGVLLVVGLVSGVYLERALTEWLETRIDGEHLRHARAAAVLLEAASPGHAIAAMDPIADRLGDSIGARVTIIAPDGAVLGDSGLTATQVQAVENHGGRPEVRDARSAGLGRATRYSTTLETDMLYLAVGFADPEGGGVVRVAEPLSEVEAAVRRLRLVLVMAGLLGLVVALLAIALSSEIAARALRRLVDSTRAVLAGEKGTRVPVPRTDELRRLAGSFNRFAEELEGVVSALGEERDYLRTILESMGDGVLVIDAEQRVTRANPAAAAILDLREAPEGHPLLETTRASALADLVSRQGTGEPATVEFDLPPGRRVLARAAPLRTSGGCVVVLHDTTELRRLETVRRDFVANVSHELRTPVSVIRANAETLLDGALDDRDHAPGFVEAIQRNADRLSRIIADLLDLARIEAGHDAIEAVPIELADAARGAVEALAGPARAKGLTVTVDVPSDLAALADEGALEHVLLNLLDNAVKYTPAGGHVVIRAREREGTVRVEVVDDGPGIEARHRERIFERFYRVDAGRSREQGGTGLGLSIVRHLVVLMGGAVGVEAARPQGAVVWFTLPSAIR